MASCTGVAATASQFTVVADVRPYYRLRTIGPALFAQLGANAKICTLNVSRFSQLFDSGDVALER